MPGTLWELSLVSCELSAPQYFEFSQKSDHRRRLGVALLLTPSLHPIYPAQPLPASLYGWGGRGVSGQQEGREQGWRVEGDKAETCFL